MIDTIHEAETSASISIPLQAAMHTTWKGDCGTADLEFATQGSWQDPEQVEAGKQRRTKPPRSTGSCRLAQWVVASQHEPL